MRPSDRRLGKDRRNELSRPQELSSKIDKQNRKRSQFCLRFRIAAGEEVQHANVAQVVQFRFVRGTSSRCANEARLPQRQTPPGRSEHESRLCQVPLNPLRGHTPFRTRFPQRSCRATSTPPPRQSPQKGQPGQAQRRRRPRCPLASYAPPPPPPGAGALRRSAAQLASPPDRQNRPPVVTLGQRRLRGASARAAIGSAESIARTVPH